MKPVAGVPGTPYGKRGPHWSCDEDANGNGKHTGVDYPAAAGTRVVAARPGTVRYVNCGSAFGNHQLAVVASDGTRDFYAHMKGRTVPDGAKVKAGDRVGTVGSEGNTTGPHLHFERHAVTSGGWSCGIIRDPKPSIDWTDDMDLQDPIDEWSPDDGTSSEQTTVGKTLNQARGYAEDTFQRLKKVEDQLDQILALLK